MVYYYTARDRDGRFVRGALHAADKQNACMALRMRSLAITSLEGNATMAGRALSLVQPRRPSVKELGALFRSLATLIAAGVSVRQALDICAQETRDRGLREAIAGVNAEIEAGKTVSDAFAQRPREFSNFIIALVRAGERAGSLDSALLRITAMLEGSHKNRSRVKAALAYPAVVALISFVITSLLLVSVVPSFEGLYSSLHVTLPASTRTLIAVSAELRKPAVWISACFLLVCAAGFLSWASQTDFGAFVFEGVKLRLPYLGALFRKVAMARLSRSLSIMLSSGLALDEALRLLDGIVSGPRYMATFSHVRSSISMGASLVEPMEGSPLFDRLFVQLIRIGEETGKLDAMLSRLADSYDIDVETALTALAATIEPAMVLILGLIVGSIVAGIFIPLYTLIGSIK